MSTLERAIALATEAHAGQLDKAGAPDILHPLRVMLRVKGEAERMAAVLHDVVEDTSVTLEQLRALGFPDRVIGAIEALTKREGEYYFAFIERAGRDDIARAVKLADIDDHLDPHRVGKLREQDEARVERYRAARRLLHVIGREHGDAEPSPPTFAPLRHNITPADLEAMCPGQRPIIACDFYVQGIEQGEMVPGGLRLGRILNVDHHAPIRSMEAPVTSTQLAIEYVRARSPGEPAPWVVINHMDCDSILASGVIMGYLPADDGFIEAAVCADHTGAPHPVADLLQSLDEGRSNIRTHAEYDESLYNLRFLLAGKPLHARAQRALSARLERRAEAKRLVEQGRVQTVGALASGRLDAEIDAAFFPTLLPDAAVIMLASPHPWVRDHWAIKVRLGLAAPSGFTLHTLRIQDWDPAFGGRWNAGSNKRGGGTTMDPEVYATMLRNRLAEILGIAPRMAERDVAQRDRPGADLDAWRPLLRTMLPAPVTEHEPDVLVGGEPGEVVADFRSGEIQIARFAVEWQGQIPVMEPVLMATFAPAVARTRDVAKAIARARAARLRTYRWCVLCRETNPPEWMSSATLCQSCASRHLGVVY